jgi:WD40 repeat protein
LTEIGSHSDVGARVRIKQSINHEGEVNRARYMPQNPDLIATKSPAGPVYIFDRTKHPSQPTDDTVKPNITLTGHTKEGYGLSWNPTDAGKGHVLSASEDTTVCHWCAAWSVQAFGSDRSSCGTQGHQRLLESQRHDGAAQHLQGPHGHR